MEQRDDILNALHAILPDLRARFGVASLAIFGSVARGEAAPDSDVDLLVAFEHGAHVTLFTLAALATHLEERLGRRVDVVEDHPRLRPGFRAAIGKDLLRVA